MDRAPDNQERGEPRRSPGAVLAAERERQGLARADVAQRLHMSVLQIEALESGDYARLPHGPFLRGFMRNYARSLGLDAEALLELLAQTGPREDAPGIVVPSQNIRFDPLGTRLANPYVKAAGIATVAIVLGFAGMYWWLFIRPHGIAPSAALKAPAVAEPVAPGAGTAPPPSPAPAPPAAPAAAETAATEKVPADKAATDKAAADKAAADKAAADKAAADKAPADRVPADRIPADRHSASAEAASAAAEPERAPGPGESTVHLAFQGAAWVEITDARGKVLVSRTHAGGTATDIYGKPPLDVVIGNAPEVRLTYNGRPFDLQPYTRVAVARFTLR